MSTQVLPAIRPQRRALWDRRFYLILALAAEAVIVAGFSRTYYLRFRYPSSPPLSLLVHLHGVVFTCWLIYFALQTLLISLQKPALHRRLGLAGAILGSLVVGMGILVSFTGMRLGHGTPTQSAEVIFLVGLIDIGSFALFFFLGYRQRRDREAHQRLMMLAVVIGLTGPGLGRLLALGVSIPVLSILYFALLLAGPIYDLVTRRRIHPVYRWGVAYALATYTPFRFILGSTPWWHHIAHLVTRT